MRDPTRGQTRQYARALLQVVEARDGEDGLAALSLRDELRGLLALFDGHPELRAALGSAGVTLPARGRVLVALAKEGGASVTLQRLVRLLAERDHLALLPELVEVYADMVNAARGIHAVQATSATALDETQERGLIHALEQVAGGEVELASRVDPAVLGGLRVKMGGRTYDGTVRARLQALRRRLASGS